MPYIAAELVKGTRLHAITRHFVGAYHGVPGARAFRRHLAEHAHLDGAGIAVLDTARRIAAGDKHFSVAAE